MTIQEAIEKIKDILEEATAYKNAVCYVTSNDEEILRMSIEALEKRIPKKPTEIHEVEDGSFYTLSFMCPSCATAIIFQPHKPKYCKHCGQKLDWSE